MTKTINRSLVAVRNTRLVGAPSADVLREAKGSSPLEMNPSQILEAFVREHGNTEEEMLCMLRNHERSRILWQPVLKALNVAEQPLFRYIVSGAFERGEKFVPDQNALNLYRRSITRGQVFSLVKERWQGCPWTARQLESVIPNVATVSTDILRAIAAEVGIPEERLKAFLDQPPAQTPSSRPRTLQAEAPAANRKKVETELGKTGLSAEEIGGLYAFSRGVVLAEDFLAHNALPGSKEGFVLGAGRPVTDIAGERTGMVAWADGYQSFFGDFQSAQTDRYMSMLVSSGRPIAFLVPPNLDRTPFTKAELKWLLNRPEAMQNVLFVVGAYSR